MWQRQIAELVPEANVAFAHGQMKETELENIMYKFHQWRDRRAGVDDDH